MFIGVPMVPYWSKLLNVRIGWESALEGNAGDDRGWIASPRRRGITPIAACRREERGASPRSGPAPM